jgi:hypothetical protein
MKIADYEDPYELWAAAQNAPAPGVCESVTKKGEPCSMFTQNNLKYCKKHWPQEDGPYPDPPFRRTASSNNLLVFYKGSYITLETAIAMLKWGDPLPIGYALHKIRSREGEFPDNLQLVPGDVLLESKRLRHQDGVPIEWSTGPGGEHIYTDAVLRIPESIAAYLKIMDVEAARLGVSRADMFSYYFRKGLELASRPESKDDL